MTDWEGMQSTAYMYAQAFSRDERYLVFCSDRDGGSRLYRLEVGTGDVVDLSGARGCAMLGLNVHPNGEEVFYVDAAGRELWAANLYTLEDRRVASAERPDWDFLSGIPGFSGDGRKVCCSWHTRPAGDSRFGRGGVAVAGCDGTPFEEVFRREEDIQHVQFCPGAGYMMTFAVYPDYQDKREGDRARRARAWRLDYASRVAEPFLVTPPGFRATHEFWSADGARLFFHKKTVGGWVPNWVCSIDAGGGDYREHFRSDTRRLGHSSVSRDNRWLLVDSQDPGENELYLVDMTTGSSEILCWPNASITGGHPCHVHPSFSPSGRMALFTSDASGKTQVYIVPLGPAVRA